MSKYYKVEDVIDTLAEQWHFEATIDYPYAADDIEEWKENARELFADLPTIEVSEDAISREYMLKLQREFHGWMPNDKSHELWLKIKNAPSVIPKAKEGEWINKGEYAECSLCGAHSGTQYDGVEPIPLETKYCPDCGKKMKGADDE